MINLRSSFLCVSMSLLIAFTSCSSDSGSGGDSPTPGVENNESVTISIDRERVLRNPMNGWVTYTGLGDGLDDAFWERYDALQSAEGTVKVSDYSHVLFIRAAWAYFNRADGDYVWDESNRNSDYPPYRRFWMLVDGAKERNMKLAFSFMVDSRDKSDSFTPMYVRDAVVAAGYSADPSESVADQEAGGYYNVSSTGALLKSRWSPYPDNPVFQEKFEGFLTAFAERFNNSDEVEFFSGFGLGLWGESHTVKYSTGDETNREAVFDWISTAYTHRFTEVPCVINYHKSILSTKGYGESDPSTAEKLLDSAVAKGYSLRHDAYGMKSYYGSWEKAYAQKWRYQTPFIGEGGWVKKTHGNSPMNNDGYSDWADVRRGEFEDAQNAHANMLDLRYSRDIVNGETYSWFNEAYDLLKKFIAEGGYRLVPDLNSLPPAISNGKSFTIETRWRNLGWGYCPNNLPQWNHKYKVAYALLDKTTEKPVYTFIDENQEVSDFHSSAKNFTVTKTLSNITTGDYVWGIGIVDTSKGDDVIGIQLAAKEDALTSEGWVKLLDVSVD